MSYYSQPLIFNRDIEQTTNFIRTCFENTTNSDCKRPINRVNCLIFFLPFIDPIILWVS